MHKRALAVPLALLMVITAGAGTARAEAVAIEPETLPAEQWSDVEIEALARIVAAEARGDTDEAQRGIMRVILNRLYSDAWGDKDVFAVISRPGQFSAYEDTHYYDRIVELRVYENVVAVLEGDDPFYGDTEVQFFRSKATKGEWKGKRKHVVDLGDTAFFR